MPRPNPESWNVTSLWESSYAADTQTPCRTYYRTYVSTNTPGWPVNSAPHAHSMDLKEEWRDPTAEWKRVPSQKQYNLGARTSWAKGPMDGSGRAVPNGYTTQFADATNVTNRAKAKIAHKVKNDKIDLGVTIAESSQAFRMFGSTTRRIADAYRALRHGDIRGLRRNIYVKPPHAASLLHRGPLDVRKHAPSLWLELQYGWKPLLSDMYGACEAVHARLAEGALYRASTSAVEQLDRWNKGVVCPGIVLADVRRNQTNRAKYQLQYWVDNSTGNTLSSLGLTNPLSVAWELVPYSFVVDWFIPVGDYLSTLDAYLGVTFHKGFEVIIKEFVGYAAYRGANGLPDWTNTARGVDVYRHVTYNRNVLTAFPRAGLPKLKNPFSALHAANAISLMSLAFDRRK